MKYLFLLLIIIFSYIPIITISSSSTTINYVINATEKIPSNYYFCYRFYVPNTSPNVAFGVYYTISNTSVITAILTSSQFLAFNQTGSFSKGYVTLQNGTLNFDGLLFTQGTYYLVVYAYQSSAKVQIFLNISSNLQEQNSSTFVGDFITIPPYQSELIRIHYETIGSPFNLTIFGISNQTVVYSLYNINSSNRPILVSPPTTVTNLGVSPLTYNYTLRDLSPGIYYLTIENNHSTPALVYFMYKVYPEYVNPFIYPMLRSGAYAPMGIASYGVINQSGIITTYTVLTNSIIGFGNITSILAYNTSAPEVGVSPYEASLQLNAMLVVDSNGSLYTYWPQNVLIFFTNQSEVELHDNVLNVTGDNATLTNNSITSPNGYVYNNYYGNYLNAPILPYRTPFAFYLILNESIVEGQGVQITMAIEVLQNGSVLNNPRVYTFDTILIHDPLAEASALVVSGNAYTPVGAHSIIGNYYDAELVFGGGGNGEITTFKQLSAELGLYYYNVTTGSYVPFPSYYSFGADTAEATYNVHVNYLGNGLVTVSTGKLDLMYLSTQSNSFTTTTTTTTQSTSTTTSTTTTTTTQSTSSTTTTTTSSTTETSVSSSTESSSIHSIINSTTSINSTSTSPQASSELGLGIIILLIIIIVVAIVLLRRRH
ncbi:hypothetical protein DMP16_06600 [Sulfolobus sp. B1]|uniref:thermopsin family protease n=1 Tax=Sulfolobus sp. B1 TaxID=2200888 RepID=UPI00117C5D42|nr:thermopsin family protease [Sulfolobus sp. B1]TRM96419.1 hypothetical protein DMP16_06600 [Sulfolobus sp. B1]